MGGGDDLVSIMPVCVCPKVMEMGSFLGVQVNEMNEKMSFKMLCKICCFIHQSLIYCDLTNMGRMDCCLSLRIDNRIL